MYSTLMEQNVMYPTVYDKRRGRLVSDHAFLLKLFSVICVKQYHAQVTIPGTLVAAHCNAIIYNCVNEVFQLQSSLCFISACRTFVHLSIVWDGIEYMG